MGSATAYHLAARGVRVLGIDQYEPPHEHGSSHGESRIIRQLYYEHPLYVPLVQRSYELWRRLEHDAKQPDLMRIVGGLMLGGEASGLIRGVRRAAREHGLPLEDIPASQMRERFPQFDLPRGISAVLDSQAGFLDPDRCVAAHLTLAAANGADLKMGEQVLDWMPNGDGVRVRTTRGVYEAGKLVLSAGPWIAELVGTRGPLFSVERQSVVWFQPPGEREMWAADRFPIFMCEFDDGQLIYGFPLLKRGWKAAVHYQGEPVTDVRRVRRTIEPHDIARVRSAVSRLFGWVSDAPVLDAATCLYTDTKDLQFVIDFLPGMPQVLVSSPCSGHGFKFATAIGELQAQLLIDGKAGFDVTPFRIDR